MSTYVGYIVGEGETNPFSVFIPALGGIPSLSFESADGFGSNMGKWDSGVIARMKIGAVKCYQTSELNPSNTYDFDAQSGLATVESNLGVLDSTTAKAVTGNKVAALGTSCPVMEEEFSMPNDWPADNCVRNYRFSSRDGTRFPSLMNAPAGTYTSLSPSTRVLVDYPGNGSIGYIIAQLPGADALSTLIKNNMAEL